MLHLIGNYKVRQENATCWSLSDRRDGRHIRDFFGHEAENAACEWARSLRIMDES